MVFIYFSLFNVNEKLKNELMIYYLFRQKIILMKMESSIF